MQSNTHIILNMQAPNVAVVVNAKQGDKLSRVITADLVDGDIPFIPPSGVAAAVRYFKPDNTIGFYDVTEDGESAIVLDGSTATVTLAEQALTVPGNVYAEINFYTSTEKLTTFNFIIHVQKSAVSDQMIESTDYFSVLTQKINAILGAAVNPPYINPDNKHWMLWSENAGEYVDSGYSSIGLVPPSTVTYQAGTSGTTPPTGEWVSTIPIVEQGAYLWTRTQFEFSDGTQQVSYSVARQGVDGTGSVSSVFGIGPDASGNVNAAPFNGLVKSNGTNLVEAAAGTDYQEPLGFNPGMVNPNLLDNWYFGNPVNQRGQTTYTGGNQYFIDRWHTPWDFGTVTILDDCVEFASSGDANNCYQYIENPERLAGKTVTLSCLVRGQGQIAIYAGEDIGSAAGYGVFLYDNDNIQFFSQTFTLGDNIPWMGALIQAKTNATSQRPNYVYAIKLELGDTQTLAHQDPAGNWVLNEIPNYGEQLARCQRFYQQYMGNFVLPGYVNGSGSDLYVIMPLAAPLRTVPAVTIETSLDVFYLKGAKGGDTYSKTDYPLTFRGSGEITDSTIVFVSANPNQELAPGGTCVAIGADNTKITISADL